MADITRNARYIAPVTETKPHMRFYRADTAIERGQPCYLMANGNIAPTNATAPAAGVASSTETFVGIALSTVVANESTSVLWDGSLYGYDIAGLAYGAKVYLSNTPGALGDAAGGVSKVVGVVLPLSDRPKTKVLYIQGRPF
jgi:hypothetical protein